MSDKCLMDKDLFVQMCVCPNVWRTNCLFGKCLSAKCLLVKCLMEKWTFLKPRNFRLFIFLSVCPLPSVPTDKQKAFPQTKSVPTDKPKIVVLYFTRWRLEWLEWLLRLVSMLEYFPSLLPRQTKLELSRPFQPRLLFESKAGAQVR